MQARVVLDVSKTPIGAVGPRAPLWWGAVGMIAIESTVFALCIATYFYLRMRQPEWPPAGAAPPALPIPLVNFALILISFIPQYRIDVAVESQYKEKLQRLLIIASVLGIAACVLRYWDFLSLNVRWNESAYGSIVWAMLFLHSIHLSASTFETILMALYVSKAPLDEKHRLDLNVNSIYWYFIVISWMAIFGVIWGGPHVL